VQSFEDTIFDLRDFFALTDLLPGAAFSLTAQTSPAPDTGILILDDAEGIVVREVISTGASSRSWPASSRPRGRS
jgi:hypothetical protein